MYKLPHVPRSPLAGGALMLCVSLAGRGARATAQAQPGACAGSRADVATLTDPNAGAIDTGQIIGVHVSALAAFPLPEALPEASRFDPYETTIYRTVGQLVSAQFGPNQDINVVVADPDSNATISVVFPDASS